MVRTREGRDPAPGVRQLRGGEGRGRRLCRLLQPRPPAARPRGHDPGREEGVPPGQAADAARGHRPTGKRKRARQRCLARSWM